MKAVCLSLARAWVQAPAVTGSNTPSPANSFRNSCRWRWIDLTVFCKTKSMTMGKVSCRSRVKSSGRTRWRWVNCRSQSCRRSFWIRSMTCVGMLSMMARIPILNSQCIYFVHSKMKLFSSKLLIQWQCTPSLSPTGEEGARRVGEGVTRRSRIKHLGDVRVVHHRQRLPLRLEPGDDLLGVHAQLDDLERDAATHGLGL